MTAGYSGTPLAKKLGIKPGHRFLLLGEPAPIPALHSTLPEAVVLHRRVTRGAEYDVIMLFVRERAEMLARWDAVVKVLHVDGGLWVAWPKKASGVATDVTEDVVRDFALAQGLVDNKVCAVDETWSGLRLVRRVADRGPRKRR